MDPLYTFGNNRVYVLKFMPVSRWLRLNKHIIRIGKIYFWPNGIRGVSAAWYRTDLNKDEFVTLSLFPVLRFTALRTKGADVYFNYSVAGPTYISKTLLDGQLTGKHFTFQDFMAMGMFAGKNRNLNAELRIAHYSNGNIFTQNAGVKIPLTFNLGYCF